MARPENLFDLRDVRAYNNHKTINAIRNNCVRAKELDARQQSNQQGSYFVAMKTLAIAILQELDIATLDEESGAKSGSDAALLDKVALYKTRSEEQEAELEELDADIEAKGKEIDSLNSTAKGMAETINKLTADNKKLTTANKKSTKGTK